MNEVVKDIDIIRQFLKKNYSIDIEYITKNLEHNMEVAAWKNKKLLLKKSGIIEHEFYIITHVFGHLVQFSENIGQHLVDVVESQSPPLSINEEIKFRDNYFQFEKQAFEIGLGLIQDSGIDPEKYIENIKKFMYVDFYFYWKYLITGEATNIDKVWNEFKSIHKCENIPSLSISTPPKTISLTDKLIIVV
jgi:hypothetical protein